MNKKLWLALVGVPVGFLLSELKEWFMRRRRRKTHWAALRAEIGFCREAAESYLRDAYSFPLYRLPTMASESSLPALAEGAWIGEDHARILFQFFSEVATLNRGLDQARSFREKEKPNLLAEESSRNRLKAERLVPGMGGATTLYDAASSVVGSCLS